jgi:hypothetical protein
MKISKAHKEFARRLNSQVALNFPENYLGPNWEAVINFWLYLDTLSEDQLKVVNKHLLSLIDKERDISWGKAWFAAKATTEYLVDVSNSVYYSVPYARCAADWSTIELIGIEKLLEQGRQPDLFPVFLNL